MSNENDQNLSPEMDISDNISSGNDFNTPEPPKQSLGGRLVKGSTENAIPAITPPPAPTTNSRSNNSSNKKATPTHSEADTSRSVRRVSVEEGYVPSPTLGKITQARIADMKELEASKGRIKEEDDPFWTLRCGLDNKKYSKDPKFDNVQARVMVPTKSYRASLREKFTREESPEKEKVITSPIDSSNNLLRPTQSILRQKWNSEAPPSAVSPPQIFSATTGPQNVSSRLMQPTKTHLARQWKSKEEVAAIEAAEVATRKANAPKVKEPSERLVSFNTSLRNSTWRPPEKEGETARERGWDVFFVDGRIPSIDEMDMSLPGNSVNPGTPGNNNGNTSGSGRKRDSLSRKSLASSVSVASNGDANSHSDEVKNAGNEYENA
eukprot:gene6106-8417_t